MALAPGFLRGQPRSLDHVFFRAKNPRADAQWYSLWRNWSYGHDFVDFFWFFSFFELGRLISSGVRFAWEVTSWSTGEFVSHGVVECGSVACSPFLGLGMHRVQEKNAIGIPDFGKAELLRLESGQLGGLSSELNQEVV